MNCKIIDMKVAGDRLRRKRAGQVYNPDPIASALKRGEKIVLVDHEADAFYFPGSEENMAHFFGMASPEPTISSRVAEGIDQEDHNDTPPLESC